MTAVIWGCRTSHVVTVDDEGAPEFGQLTIVYELVEPAIATPTIATVSGTPLDLESAKAHPLRAAYASHRAPTPVEAATPNLRLTVECPAPNRSTRDGLITLAAPTRTPGEWQTVAEQMLPRAEVDLLLMHLANGGVGDSGVRTLGKARLSLDIDGHRIARPWTREPRLDRLAVETYDARSR